jgi:hypothetical protein
MLVGLIRGDHRSVTVGFEPKNENLIKIEMHKLPPTSAHFLRRLTVGSDSGLFGRIYTDKRLKKLAAIFANQTWIWCFRDLCQLEVILLCRSDSELVRRRMNVCNFIRN